MIKVLNYTKKPICHFGEVAGVCWGANIKDEERNFKRGIDCIKANHGRILEFSDVELIIDDYSARVIREVYTHIQGTSKIQESTRYVDCSKFGYYTPNTIGNNEIAKEIYDNTMESIKKAYKELEELNIPKEDIANTLPLGMSTKIVLKINVRALVHMFELRTCARAYKEYRQLMKDIKVSLSELDNEWELLCEKVFLTRCDKSNYCTETYSCNKYPKLQINI